MTVEGDQGATEDDAGAYLRGLTYSDRAMRKFISGLNDSVGEDRGRVLR